MQTGIAGDSVVKFNVVNLTKPDSLFAMGMRPVLYSHRDAAGKGLGWQRCGQSIDYRRCESKNGPRRNQHVLHHRRSTKNVVFIACYLVVRVTHGGRSVSPHGTSLAVPFCK